jgi:hypothetical protein
MNKRLDRIVETTLKQLIKEAPAQETDNAGSTSADSLFTPAQEKFLGKFDAYGTNHLGIIYSVSDTGIREFIARSGKDLNLTPSILLSLLRTKIVKLVPYGGFGRNDDYTIELQLTLDDVKGLGAEDKKNIESGTSGGGAGAPPPAEPSTPPPPPGPENAWVVKYGDILRESVNITKRLITESPKKTKKPADAISKTRVFQRLPKQYITHMERVIKAMDKEATSKHEKTRIIADVLDILQVKMKLTPKDIQKSFEFHKNQKRLQKFLDKN